MIDLRLKIRSDQGVRKVVCRDIYPNIEPFKTTAGILLNASSYFAG